MAPCRWSTSVGRARRTMPTDCNCAHRRCAWRRCLGGCARWVPLLRRNAFARKVEFDESLRALVGSMAEEMHALYRRRHTPRVKPFSARRSCSLNDLCLPRAINRATVGAWSKAFRGGEELQGICSTRFTCSRKTRISCSMRRTWLYVAMAQSLDECRSIRSRASSAFADASASPRHAGACVERGVGLSFFDRKGRFLAGAYGEQRGNVLLRKTQYAWSEDTEKSLAIARNFIVGKLYNGRWVLERAVRDHGLRIDTGSVKATSMRLDGSLRSAAECETMDSLRGIEGDAAAEYFGVFDELVLRDRETFRFTGRARRPPTDAMNAMLSLFYTVLAFDCASALEGVELRSVPRGFSHADRPG